MYNYRLLNDENDDTRSTVIERIALDGTLSVVPNDPANADWQEYQRWLALGNEPLPAE